MKEQDVFKQNIPGGTFILLAILIVPIVWLFATQERDVAAPPPKIDRVAQTPVVARQGALICYDLDSWLSMRSGILDRNYQQIGNLLKDAKCQKLADRTPAIRIDAFDKNQSLIQMPSGRSAYIFDQDLLHK